MNQEFIEQQRNKLLREKQEVEERLKEIAFKVPGYKDEWEAVVKISSQQGSVADDEKADRVEELYSRHETEHLLEEKLRKIKKALEKIERGDYGICERCRKEISQERLLAEPEAQECQNCANT